MTGIRAYLDHNATSPLRPAACGAVVAAMETVGNPSSVHGEGRNAKRIVEQGRAKVAALVSAAPESVVFTSSATEAAHLALTPNIRGDGIQRDAGKLYVLEVEHPCVLAGGRFAPQDIVAIPVLESGLIDMDGFDALLDAHENQSGRPYVAVQLVNSETGVVQPVAEVSKRVGFRGGYVVCDVVQAAGRIPIDIKNLGVDFLMLSAHKLGGPMGVGALVNAHAILDLAPAIRGGGQESNRRAGTENVPAIAGFGAAAKEAAVDACHYARITTLRDSLEAGLASICAALGLSDWPTIFGQDVERVGNTTLFALNGLKAETALIAFDLDGVAVSSGSACSSGKIGNSHVLEAMNAAPKLADGAIRVSLGWNSTQEDVAKFLAVFKRITADLAKRLGSETQDSAAA
ncbi:MAG: cysteine desulfurase family protein [Rhizobiaceae bacterium]